MKNLRFKHKKIRAGKKYIEALVFGLLEKNLVILKGARGYIMCGYLDLKTADKFKEAAVKIVKVAAITDAMASYVHSCSQKAREMGIYPGQPIKEVIKIIA